MTLKETFAKDLMISCNTQGKRHGPTVHAKLYIWLPVGVVGRPITVALIGPATGTFGACLTSMSDELPSSILPATIATIDEL